MDITFGTREEIFRLAIIICCDDPPPRADAAVIFGETRVNTDSLVESLGEIWLQRHAINLRTIGISAGYLLGEKIMASYQEIESGLKRFGRIGVDPNAIVSFPLSPKLPPCTDAEAIGLVDFAKEQGWKSVILVAPPLHGCRAFVSLVSAILKAGSDLIVWNWVCDVRAWDEEIIHSQSAPRNKRLNLLDGELEKIETYFRKGDHVSAREVLEYIAGRYK